MSDHTDQPSDADPVPSSDTGLTWISPPDNQWSTTPSAPPSPPLPPVVAPVPHESAAPHWSPDAAAASISPAWTPPAPPSPVDAPVPPTAAWTPPPAPAPVESTPPAPTGWAADAPAQPFPQPAMPVAAPAQPSWGQPAVPTPPPAPPAWGQTPPAPLGPPPGAPSWQAPAAGGWQPSGGPAPAAPGWPQPAPGQQFPPQFQQPTPGWPQPQMGMPMPGQYGAYTPTATNPHDSQGVLTLILSIVGFFTCFITSVVALFLGYNNKKKAQEAGWPEPGSNKAGRIIGIIGTVLLAISLLFFIIGILAGSGSA